MDGEDKREIIPTYYSPAPGTKVLIYTDEGSFGFASWAVAMEFVINRARVEFGQELAAAKKEHGEPEHGSDCPGWPRCVEYTPPLTHTDTVGDWPHSDQCSGVDCGEPLPFEPEDYPLHTANCPAHCGCRGGYAR